MRPGDLLRDDLKADGTVTSGEHACDTVHLDDTPSSGRRRPGVNEDGQLVLLKRK